ncbi:MAG: cupredoxin domain-containing protein [Candidatus Omnitrophica bacterium]|nr:cupredoxin domain-containing protein [Candidatus Omnitrophota bacterium]
MIALVLCEAAGPSLSGEVIDGIRVVKVTAMQYKFNPDPVIVKKGEKVRLVVTSADVEHGLSITEFNVAVVIPALKTVTVEFTPDKAGTFRIFCSVYCGSGHSMMQGKLIVNEN